MEIFELTLKLILLLIPGGLACVIYEGLTTHKQMTSFKFVTNVILFGAISYFVSGVLFNISGTDESFVSFWDNLRSKEIPYKVILKSSLISIFVGLISTGIHYYKSFNRFGKRIRLRAK